MEVLNQTNPKSQNSSSFWAEYMLEPKEPDFNENDQTETPTTNMDAETEYQVLEKLTNAN